MGRLPKKVTTNTSTRLSPKTWSWFAVCVIGLGVYAYYNLSQFSFHIRLPKAITKSKPLALSEDLPPVPEMQAPTTQDLQALPMTQESAEEVIAISDLKNDELIQIFHDQEQAATKSVVKPKAPIVVKRSLGLV